MPARAALTLVIDPVNTIADVPLAPDAKLSPAMPDSVSVPLVTDSVTLTGSSPIAGFGWSASSTSAIDRALALAVEKVIEPSSAIVRAPGTVFVGASLTALTVMVTLFGDDWAPPEPKF